MDLGQIAHSAMLTLLDRIQQKLPQAPESVLQQVWTILNAAGDEELNNEFDRWEAASDEDEVEDEAQIEASLIRTIAHAISTRSI